MIKSNIQYEFRASPHSANWSGNHFIIVSKSILSLCAFITISGAGSIGLYVNLDKTEFMCFNQDCSITSLIVKPLKLLDQFIYLGNNISSPESDANTHIGKAWTAINNLM